MKIFEIINKLLSEKSKSLIILIFGYASRFVTPIVSLTKVCTVQLLCITVQYLSHRGGWPQGHISVIVLDFSVFCGILFETRILVVVGYNIILYIIIYTVYNT